MLTFRCCKRFQICDIFSDHPRPRLPIESARRNPLSMSPGGQGHQQKARETRRSWDVTWLQAAHRSWQEPLATVGGIPRRWQRLKGIPAVANGPGKSRRRFCAGAFADAAAGRRTRIRRLPTSVRMSIGCRYEVGHAQLVLQINPGKGRTGDRLGGEVLCRARWHREAADPSACALGVLETSRFCQTERVSPNKVEQGRDVSMLPASHPSSSLAYTSHTWASFGFQSGLGGQKSCREQAIKTASCSMRYRSGLQIERIG